MDGSKIMAHFKPLVCLELGILQWMGLYYSTRQSLHFKHHQLSESSLNFQMHGIH